MSMKEKVTGDAKVILVYKDFDGNIQIESVWAEKMDEYYRIVNIPFFAKNIAYGDIIKVEEEDGELYFEELIMPSGHSTIQMIIYNVDSVEEIGDQLVLLGCDWEGSHLPGYISVDVPNSIPYASIKEYLDSGLLSERWDYNEACLAHTL